MVQQLLCHPAAGFVRLTGGSAGQQGRKGIRRGIQRRAALFPAQSAGSGGPPSAGRSPPGSAWPCGRPGSAATGQPVFQSRKKAVVGHTVPQLPPGQDHAHVCRRVEAPGQTRRSAGGGRDAPRSGAGTSPLFRGTAPWLKTPGRSSDHPSGQSVPPPQSVAQTAVCAAEYLPLLLRQLSIGGAHSRTRVRIPVGWCRSNSPPAWPCGRRPRWHGERSGAARRWRWRAPALRQALRQEI